MRRSTVLLALVLIAGLGLAILLLAIFPARPAPSLAAPRSDNRDLSWPYGASLDATSVVSCYLSSNTVDGLHGNNYITTAVALASYANLALVEGNANTYQPAHDDYFRLDGAVPNNTYVVSAVPNLGTNYNLGIIVYDSDFTPIITDTYAFNNRADVALLATNSGPYYFRIFQITPSCSGGTYTLTPQQQTPTPTPTSTSTPSPTPTPQGATPIPGADRFEPNFDFAHATTLAIDVTYSNLNFVPWGGGTEDNDFYKIWVKPGLLYTCETSELGPGVDTNLIVYRAPDFNAAVGGNDDREPGDYSSRFSYLSNYEGYLYLLVGTGGRLPYSEVGNSTYSFRCSMSVPGIPTPVPTATPRPTVPGSTPEASPSPLPTPIPTESGALNVRPLATPTPPSAPATPALHFVPIDLLVYYDANNDRSPGAGEGVAGLLVLAYDTGSGQQIAQGFTDELGHLQFTAAAQGAVRLNIPYLGINQLVGSDGASIYIRLGPRGTP